MYYPLVQGTLKLLHLQSSIFLQCMLVYCMHVHMYVTCMYASFLCMYMVDSVAQQTYHPHKRCISSVPLCSTSCPSQCSCYGCWSSPQTSSPCTTSTQWSDRSGRLLSGDCGSHSMSPRAESLGCESTKRRACDTIQGLLPFKRCSRVKETLVNKDSSPQTLHIIIVKLSWVRTK